MTIEIKRKTHYLGIFSRVKLYANGELITKLAINETCYYEPEQDLTSLKVKQFGSGSKTVSVRDSAKVTISVNPYYTLIYIIGLLLLLTGILTFSNVLLFTSILSFIVLFVLSFFNTFTLREEKDNQ